MGIQIKLKLWEDFSFHLDIMLLYPPHLAQMLMANFFWEYFQKKPYPQQNICADFVYNPPKWNTCQEYPQYRFISTTAFFLILLFPIFGQILSPSFKWSVFSVFFANISSNRKTLENNYNSNFKVPIYLRKNKFNGFKINIR